MGGDTAPRGIIINENNGASCVVTGRILVEDCDFRNFTGGGGNELYVGTNSAPYVEAQNIRTVSWPSSEISFTPGASTVAAQYVGAYSGTMTVTGGTVTVVSIGSTSGGTFYQVASGSNVAFPIRNGQWVKITYSSVPTCKVMIL